MQGSEGKHTAAPLSSSATGGPTVKRRKKGHEAMQTEAQPKVLALLLLWPTCSVAGHRFRSSLRTQHADVEGSQRLPGITKPAWLIRRSCLPAMLTTITMVCSSNISLGTFGIVRFSSPRAISISRACWNGCCALADRGPGGCSQCQQLGGHVYHNLMQPTHGRLLMCLISPGDSCFPYI